MSVVNPVAKDKAAPEIKPIIEGMSKKFGKVPNFFGVMAQRPEVLATFVPLYGAVTGPGGVAPKLKELAYLKTSQVNGCEYCSRAHVASSKQTGVTDEQVRALTFFERSPLFDEREKAVLLYADRLTRGAVGMRDRALEELRKHFSEEDIVELTLVICIANFTNRFNDGLRVEPDLG